MTDNAPEIRRMNLRSIRASIDFFKYLTVRGGRLIRNGNRYTLEVGSSGGGRWSGYYKWGGEFFGGSELRDDIQGRYFGVDLKDPTVTHWADEPDEMVQDVEWSYVANKNEETGEYTLSSRTCGDIVIRSV